jgi:hypothetical protein
MRALSASLLVLSCLSFSKGSIADESRGFSDFVVKIASLPCDEETKTFQGSGFLFGYEGASYVLTSEHVIYHSGQGFCHFVSHARLAKREEAELVRADWGAGLALLKLPKAKASDLPRFETLAKAGFAERERVTAAGFPLLSNELVRDPRCQVLSEKSHRAFIPLVSDFIEIDGCHTEYGMSGGIVFQQEKGLAGLISHQLLKQSVGPSSVIEMRPEVTPDEHHFFLIPWSFASVWVQSALSANVPTSAVRDPISQLGGSAVILTMGLRFSANQDKRNGEVGGADGHGVGGGKGEASDFVVRVTHSNSTTVTRYPLEVRKRWFEKLRERTLRGKKIQIPYFLRWKRASATPSATRIFFRSLAEFFSLLNESDLEPVSLIENESDADLPPLSRELKESGNQMAEICRTLLADAKVKEQEEVTKLLNQILVLSDLIKAESFDLIHADWLKRLQDAQGKGWQQLCLLDFSAAVSLGTQLLNVQKNLAKERM